MVEPVMEATPIRISTITILSFLNATVDLTAMFDTLPLISSPREEEEEEEEGVFEMRIHEKDKERSTRCLVIKSRSSETGEEIITRVPVGSHFQNQLTVLWYYRNQKNEMRKVNSMIFSNGKIKAVGLQSEKDTELSLLALQRYLERHRTASAFATMEALVFTNTVCCMINTDFMVPYRILREEVYHLMRSKYKVLASYEPDIYPGVKIRYYCNHASEGRCTCAQKCNGKKPGTGEGDGCCKAVTICVFQSGKIIITGANRFPQIQRCYEFITGVLRDHQAQLIYKEPTQLKSYSKQMVT